MRYGKERNLASLDSHERNDILDLIGRAGYDLVNHNQMIGFVVPEDVTLMEAAADLTYSFGDESDLMADLFCFAKISTDGDQTIIYFDGLTWPAEE